MASQSAASPGLVTLVLLTLCGGCPQAGSGSGATTSPTVRDGAVPAQAPPSPDRFAATAEVVLVDGAHDTLGAARLGLEAALKLALNLPLPYPRVERHADRFRVVLGRGPFGTLKPLVQALAAAGHPVQVQAAGQAGGDDVIRLGIVCTEGESVPLYAAKGQPAKEIARLRHGQVVVLKEDEEEPRHGGHGDDEGSGGGGGEVAERGFLTVLQPQAGLVRGPDVLLPADCTPRDEDNDDGNGRILGASAPGEAGRLCLTTRFSGRVAHLSRADVLAVAPSYRRCAHFVGAGTFDGFDHSRNGSHFAVEVDETLQPPSNPLPPGTSTPFVGLRLYAVEPSGVLKSRGQWTGMSRPAFLGDHLVALSEEPAALSVMVIDGAGRREVSDASALPPPRRIASLAVTDIPRLSDKIPVHRPGAPTFSNGRLHTSFLRGCRPDWTKRVRTAAGKSYVQCVLEIEVEVGLGGERLERKCKLDNVENVLEQSITIPCP